MIKLVFRCLALLHFAVIHYSISVYRYSLIDKFILLPAVVFVFEDIALLYCCIVVPIWNRQVFKDGLRRTIMGGSGKRKKNVRYFSRQELKQLFTLFPAGECRVS